MKKKGEAPREEISYVHILIALSVFVVCLCPFWVNHHSPHAQAGHVRPKTRHDARGLLAQGSPAGHAESVHMRSGIDTVALSASIQAMGDKQGPASKLLRKLVHLESIGEELHPVQEQGSACERAGENNGCCSGVGHTACDWPAPAGPDPQQALHGITYLPYGVDHGQLCLSAEQVQADLQIMSTFTRRIRTYSLTVCLDNTHSILEAAVKLGLQVTLGLWITTAQETTDSELATLSVLLEHYGSSIETVVVGNDAIGMSQVPLRDMLQHIKRTRAVIEASGVRVKVATAEFSSIWWQPETGHLLAEAVDLALVNIQPYWEGFHADCPAEAFATVAKQRPAQAQGRPAEGNAAQDAVLQMLGLQQGPQALGSSELKQAVLDADQSSKKHQIYRQPTVQDAEHLCADAPVYVHLETEGLENYFRAKGLPIPFIVGEVGWPTNGEVCCGGPTAGQPNNAVPSTANTEYMVNKFVSEARARGRAYFWHSFADADWKRMWDPCGPGICPVAEEQIYGVVQTTTCTFDSGELCCAALTLPWHGDGLTCEERGGCEVEYHWGVFDTHRVIKPAYQLFFSSQAGFGSSSMHPSRQQQYNTQQQSILGLYIINSSGSLIYDQLFGKANPTRENETLSLASTWDSMSLIAVQLSPIAGCSGITCMEADTFTVEVFQTLTGIKFLLFVMPGTKYADQVLQAVYRLYADYAMKDPYYQMDMRIKSDLFRTKLTQAMMSFEAPA